MGRSGRARSAASFVAAAVLMAPGAAHAGGYPSSAKAIALQMNSSLVDSPALAFEHPQATILGESSLSAYDGVDYGANSAVQACWIAGNRIAVAAASERMRNDLDFSSVYGRSARGAVRVGAFRFGAALRRGTYEESREYEDSQIRNDGVYTYLRRYRSTFSVREITAGSGWSRGRMRLDLAAETSVIEATNTYRNEETGRAPEATELALDTERLWGGSLRATVPVDDRTTVTATGSFRDRRSSTDLSILNRYGIWATFSQPTYGHRWQAHLSVARESSVGMVHLHGGYTDWRGVEASASSSLEYTQNRSETTEAGVAIEKPGWWDSTLYVGARAYRVRDWRDQIRIAPEYQDFDRDSRSEERWFQSFSWGAARTLGDLDLVAVVERDLRVADPFITMDARLRF